MHTNQNYEKTNKPVKAEQKVKREKHTWKRTDKRQQEKERG